jgi:catechol 2,3-dioxygenase-like lactoylglutathione lyase family enzyme|tara:strand:- start:8107 stop:8919 length:813 start_codon:yes stop_codon:yes gene_type:complete
MSIQINRSHYAVAVNNLNEAIDTYNRTLGLEVTEKGENPWGNFSWAQMGFAGEQAIQLIQPNNDDTHVKRSMQSRINKNNQYGEGYYISVWQSQDPVIAAKNVESNGGRIIDRGDGTGVHWIHHSAAHGLFMEIVPLKDSFEGEKLLELSHLVLLANNLDLALKNFSKRFNWQPFKVTEDILDSKSSIIGNTEPQLAIVDSSKPTIQMQNYITDNALKNNEGFYAGCWKTKSLIKFQEKLDDKNIDYKLSNNQIFLSAEIMHGINTIIIE